jgi:hypothetical protein
MSLRYVLIVGVVEVVAMTAFFPPGFGGKTRSLAGRARSGTITLAIFLP